MRIQCLWMDDREAVSQERGAVVAPARRMPGERADRTKGAAMRRSNGAHRPAAVETATRVVLQAYQTWECTWERLSFVRAPMQRFEPVQGAEESIHRCQVHIFEGGRAGRSTAWRRRVSEITEVEAGQAQRQGQGRLG